MVCTLQNLDKIWSVLRILVTEECVGRTCRTSPTSPPNSMDVVLHTSWEIIINHDPVRRFWKDCQWVTFKNLCRIQNVCIHHFIISVTMTMAQLLKWLEGKALKNWEATKTQPYLMSFMSKPRAATSVATSTGHLPLRKSFNTESLSDCDLSPWIAEAPYCRDRFLANWSHILLVEQNIMIFDPGSCDRKIWSSRLDFSICGMTSTCCSVQQTTSKYRNKVSGLKKKENNILTHLSNWLICNQLISVSNVNLNWVIQ